MRITESRLRSIIRSVIKESLEKDLNFVDNKMFVYEESHFSGTRKIVIVKTKSYGNVAFYKRSGHGNSNSLNTEQATKLEWLPFGGLCTELQKLMTKDYRSQKLTAGGTDWFCKLPADHPESDGTGKFLKKDGEFYKICLSLSKNYSESDFEIVKVNELVNEYFGKSLEELNKIDFKDLKFRIPMLSDSLFGGIAINAKLKEAKAIQDSWLPSGRFEWTGTDRWGFIIKEKCKVSAFNGEVLKKIIMAKY